MNAFFGYSENNPAARVASIAIIYVSPTTGLQISSIFPPFKKRRIHITLIICGLFACCRLVNVIEREYRRPFSCIGDLSVLQRAGLLYFNSHLKEIVLSARVLYLCGF